MFKLIDFDHVQSCRIRQFAGYWQSKRAGGQVPLRREIDPIELKPLLPYMIVVEIEAEPFRVLYRLAGTKVVEMNRIELTGRYLDTLDEGSVNYTREGIEAYRLAWSQQEPVFGSYSWPTPSGTEYQIEFAIFPVREPGSDGQCIAIEDWEIDPVVAARQEPPLPYVKAPPAKPRR